MHKASYHKSEVAVKANRLGDQYVHCESAIRALLEEARKEGKHMKRLRHPNVVEFFGVAVEYNSSSITVMN